MHYNFQFMEKKTSVTIYKTGQVRFCKEVVKEFQLENSRLRWGVDAEHNLLAFRKDEKGKRLRGGKTFTINCPIQIARRFVGKYSIERNGEDYILRRIPTY